ncbi:MAG: ATP-binding protein, partial [Chloroflexota bacterium]|nr:ATP-binding protein [Chloroflexota bacterium]
TMTPAFYALHMPSISVTQPLQGTPWQGTVTTSNGYQVRFYSIRLMNNRTLFGVIQVGQSLTPLNTSLQKIVEELFLIAPFALLLGIIGSYWLAARAFVPIRHLTSIAEDISAGDLHRRVPVPRARDEVQHLALTFNKMIGRLNQTFMQQRRFVADASHELRTPVATIRSMTDVALAQSPNAEEGISVLRDVNTEAERMGWLIRDLLILARSDEGQVQLDQELVQLDLLVSDVVATLELLAVERNIVLQVQKLGPATVRGDTSRLIQCVINLLDNALTYTNAGGRVTLIVETRDGCGCIVVQDTGIGIAPEDILHIFERFYRADPARTRRAGGSGLGLSIVDWVICAHGGSLHVESQVGQGSTFTLSLPLANDS